MAPRTLDEAVAIMAQAGVEWIQLRAKHLADDELYRQAEACCRTVEGLSTFLWVDDRADLARLLPVAGLHVGQQDLPPAAARRIIGDKWIGCSTHDETQARAAEEDPNVDVIAIGPIFSTLSKENAEPVVGLELLRRVRERTSKPIVAIGGIGPENAARVWESGADAVAMIGAVCSGDVAANCHRLLATAREVHEHG